MLPKYGDGTLRWASSFQPLSAVELYNGAGGGRGLVQKCVLCCKQLVACLLYAKRVFCWHNIPLPAHWWTCKVHLLMTGKKAGSHWLLKPMGLLDSSGIALLVAGSTAFHLPVASRAARYRCLYLRLSFFSVPGSCRLAARVLDVMEKSSFVK